MKPRGIILTGLLIVLLSCLGVQKCAELETSPLDRAVIACLDEAWSITHMLEVAGGVVRNEQGDLVCTSMVLGLPDKVEFFIYPSWLAHYHTHPIEVQSSPLDQDNVKTVDIRGRPSYIRTPSGAVWVYECLFAEHDIIVTRECQERKVRHGD